MEQIKLGSLFFDLVPDGVRLSDTGGTITFQRGEKVFDAIDEELKKNGNITQFGTSGEEDWTRSDLAYAGKLTKQSNYEISTGVKVDAMIAEFRTPDVREQIVETNSRVMYLSMMTGVGMEVFL